MAGWLGSTVPSVVSTAATHRRLLPLTCVSAPASAGTVPSLGHGWLPQFRMLVKTTHEYPPRTTGLNVGSTDANRSEGSGGSFAAARRSGAPPSSVAM